MTSNMTVELVRSSVTEDVDRRTDFSRSGANDLAAIMRTIH